MAFDITKPVQENTLTPEEKTWLDSHIKTVEEAAVTTFKTNSETERKKLIPENYEVKFADGTPLDPKVDGVEIVAYLKAQGFTAEQAKAHLEHLQKISTRITDRQKTNLSETVAKWADDAKADKEYGLDKWPVTEQHIKRAMDKFAPEGSMFRKLLAESGYGNHPEFVRFVANVGRAMREDTTILGGGGGGEPKKEYGPGERMFKDLVKK